ncbi:hypothetical protein HXX76_004985 [Chlamydomonas incerta]|uniref:Uncharacterized protein n=1 Tax=Chlamydomonas incerta TaxID=51695 RepID=A0A835W6Y8_CHLIN|nr:hypothetical protein HXX76_004985 [Chlamydomonas incerta]|eukprot:KAG2439633.1 hypothetical protein HXX76_004985 [Chlamydomonas incerta]
MDEIRRRNAPREALAAAGKAVLAQDVRGAWLLHSFSSDLERPPPPHLPRPPQHPLRAHTPQQQQTQQSAPAEPETVAPPSPAQLQARQAALATATSAPAPYAPLTPGAWGAPDSRLGGAPLSCPSYSALLPTDSSGSVRVPHPLIEFVELTSSGGTAPGSAAAAGELGSSRSLCGAAAPDPATDSLLNGLLATVLQRQKSVSTRFLMQSRKVKDQDADGLVDEQLPDLAEVLAQAAAAAAVQGQEQLAAAGDAGLRRSLSRSRSKRSNHGGRRRSSPSPSRSPSRSRSRSPIPGRRRAVSRTQSLRDSTNGMGAQSSSNSGGGVGTAAAAASALAPSTSALAPSTSFTAAGACPLDVARSNSTRFSPTPPPSGPPSASTNSAGGAPSVSALQQPTDLTSFQQARRQRLQQQPLRPHASTGCGGGSRGGGAGVPLSADGRVPRSSSSFARMPASRRVVTGGVSQSQSQSLDGSAWASASGAAAAAAALAGESRPHTPRLQVPEPNGDGLHLPRLPSTSGMACPQTQPAGEAAAAAASAGVARAAAGGGAATSAWSAPGAAPAVESSGSAFSPRLRSSGSRSRFQSPSSSRRLIPTAVAAAAGGGGGGGGAGGNNGVRPSSPGSFVPLTQGQSWWARSTVARELVFLK